MSAATVSGFAHSAPRFSPAVIGVSTMPGRMVTTRTFDACKRWRSPAANAETAAFAAPYT